MKLDAKVIIRICYVVLFLLGAVSVKLYGEVFLGRLFYPYQIEWIEGGIFQQVVRITQGYSLYVDPSMEFVPALYMPMYYYLSAALSILTGKTLVTLRLVSVMASLITCVSLYFSARALSRQISPSWWAALLVIPCYLVTFRFTGFWFDVARVDSLWVMWLSLSLMALVFSTSRHTCFYLALSAIFFACAFFTKQPSLFVFPFLVFAVSVWHRFKLVLWFSTFSVILLVLLCFCMQWILGKNFFFYTLQMAGSHDFNWHRIDVFLLDNLLFSVPMLLVLSLYFVCSCSAEWRFRLGWMALLVGFGSMSAVSRMYSGGVYNVMMPFYMLLALMGCVGLIRLLNKANDWRAALPAVFASALLGLNFIWGWFRPADQIPTEASRAFGDSLVREISKVQGRVCLTKDGYLAYLAGKDFCAHNALMVDVMNGGNDVLREMLAADVRNKVKEGYYEVIVINNPIELTDFGIPNSVIPYTAHRLPFDESRFTGQEFFPVVMGPSPGTWLVFNGQAWLDQR